VAEWLKALSDPTRLRLLHALKIGGERSVTELLAGCSCSQANVSRHLAVLREQGLVSCRRDGMRILYRIADPAVFAVCDTVCSSIGRPLPKEGAERS
jgi:DNA-binding transcriptional ArsR family regulator